MIEVAGLSGKDKKGVKKQTERSEFQGHLHFVAWTLERGKQRLKSRSPPSVDNLVNKSVS